jgi:tRNA pseudouridine65 synthase
VWPVHRLDKGTSGVLAFALDAQTARTMGLRFESGEGLKKTYRAIVRGWPEDAGLIDHALKRMPDDMRSEREAYQAAQTAYTTLHRGKLALSHGDFATTRWAEVELQPLTGRRHQLRRHMKHIAHPIIGDATHGKGPLNRAIAEHLGIQRLWLHAMRLEMRHPVSLEPLAIAAPPEPEWDLWHAYTSR